MSLTTLFTTPTPKFDVADGRRASQQAVALARELGDRKAESKALWNLMNLNVYGGGDNAEAVEAGERSLALARELDAREQVAFTLTDIWRLYTAIGEKSCSMYFSQMRTPSPRASRRGKVRRMRLMCREDSSLPYFAGMATSLTRQLRMLR